MNLKVKKLYPDARLPTRSNPTGAGLDLYCHRKEAPENDIHSMLDVLYTGVAVEIPEGYVGLLFPRSSITNTKHRLANSVIRIDSSFRGEIQFRFEDSVAVPMVSAVVQHAVKEQLKAIEVEDEQREDEMRRKAQKFYTRFKAIGAAEYQIGDRIGQLVIVPCALLDVEEVEELSDSARGAGGFGSTGV